MHGATVKKKYCFTWLRFN